jgi:two-component system, OmpR family, sensor histidine kinase BaeS
LAVRIVILRLLPQLALALVAAIVLPVTVISVATVWNLRAGFSSYLETRDQGELEKFSKLVAARFATEPSLSSLRGSREKMRSLIDEAGVPPPKPMYERSAAAAAPEISLIDRRSNPLPPIGVMHDPASNILRRVFVVGPDGSPIAGHPIASELATLRSPIVIDGRVVGFALLPTVSRLESVDREFLSKQYASLLVVVAATVVSALALAYWAARRMNRPLAEIRGAAQNIAKGNYAIALPTHPTQEIAELLQTINQMAQSLQRLEETRRSWLAQISHELRTPLSILQGELEAILDGARKPDLAVFAGLHDEARHLALLVNDLHQLAIADLDGVKCSFEWGNIGQRLTRMTTLFEPLATRAGLRLNVHPFPDVEAYWDFLRIEQLISGLFDNSIFYTSAPGCVEVISVIDARRKSFSLIVSDSAPGVMVHELPRLFEPLFRANTPTTSSVRRGSGLGLAIAKSIVEAHRGTICAEQSDLGGISIHVQLPLEAR